MKASHAIAAEEGMRQTAEAYARLSPKKKTAYWDAIDRRDVQRQFADGVRAGTLNNGIGAATSTIQINPMAGMKPKVNIDREMMDQHYTAIANMDKLRVDAAKRRAATDAQIQDAFARTSSNPVKAVIPGTASRIGKNASLNNMMMTSKATMAQITNARPGAAPRLPRTVLKPQTSPRALV